MGTAKIALVIAALGVRVARAEPCTGMSAKGARFAACFDPGNRLSITAGSDGLGGAIALRHDITFEDDPDLVWKMDHQLLDGVHAALENRFTGTLYRGRYLRHARDGHIVLPFGGDAQKVFLPFDIGAFAEVGTIDWRPELPDARIGVVRTAALVDVARSRDLRRLFALGPVAHWDIDLARQPLAIADHAVAPFSAGLALVHVESVTGLTSFDLRAEAGTAWHSAAGWHPEARAEASLERIVLAVNDRPIALVLGVRYDTARSEATARIGARIVLFDRTDPRVHLDPIAAR